MAESSEGDEEGKLTGGNPQLVVDDGLREMAKKAAWSVSSCKPGNGVASLRDDNLDTYWHDKLGRFRGTIDMEYAGWDDGVFVRCEIGS